MNKKNTSRDPGDLLYLPPGVEHDGVALEQCFTYSIGFRAPRGAELGAAFLDWLHERGLPDAALPRPAASRRRRAPARIPARNVRTSARKPARAHPLVARATWNDFLGDTSARPSRTWSSGRSGRSARARQVRAGPEDALLYCGERFFINGEAFSVRASRGCCASSPTGAGPTGALASHRSPA